MVSSDMATDKLLEKIKEKFAIQDKFTLWYKKQNGLLGSMGDSRWVIGARERGGGETDGQTRQGERQKMIIHSFLLLVDSFCPQLDRIHVSFYPLPLPLPLLLKGWWMWLEITMTSYYGV